MNNFSEMPVWQKAMDAAVFIFHATEKLPRKEDYGFTSQIRRSALSISANIAEGFGRQHSAEKAHFYFFARGSLEETRSHLEYGRRVGYIDETESNTLKSNLQTVLFELNSLIARFKGK